MARSNAPVECPSRQGPRLIRMPTGTRWWRIHGASHDATSFRTTGAITKRAEPRKHGNEGRFDCQDGEYGYCYLGQTRDTPIAEAFLRGDAIRDPATRTLRRSAADGRVVTCLEQVVDLRMIGLRGAEELSRIGQDAWLTACDEDDYPLTQGYATAMRRWASTAAGLVWMAKRDNVHLAAVLFDDRTPDGALRVHASRPLDDPLGLTLLSATLARFSVAF